MRKAFTLVELLLVFSLVAILATGAAISFWGVRTNQALAASANNLQIVLSRARIYSRDGRDEKGWGVIKSGEATYNLVEGEPRSFTVVQSFALDSPTRFSNGGWAVWFNPGSGSTAVDINISLTNPRGAVTVVEVTAAGVIGIKPI